LFCHRILLPLTAVMIISDVPMF